MLVLEKVASQNPSLRLMISVLTNKKAAALLGSGPACTHPNLGPTSMDQ